MRTCSANAAKPSVGETFSLTKSAAGNWSGSTRCYRWGGAARSRATDLARTTASVQSTAARLRIPTPSADPDAKCLARSHRPHGRGRTAGNRRRHANLRLILLRPRPSGADRGRRTCHHPDQPRHGRSVRAENRRIGSGYGGARLSRARLGKRRPVSHVDRTYRQNVARATCRRSCGNSRSSAAGLPRNRSAARNPAACGLA